MSNYSALLSVLVISFVSGQVVDFSYVFLPVTVDRCVAVELKYVLAPCANRTIGHANKHFSDGEALGHTP